jgi:hypothetical protein
MILAKELERLVRWRIAFMNECVHALLACRHLRYGSPDQGASLAVSFSIGSADTLDRQGGLARLLGDEPVLFLDHGAHRGITIEATQDFAWHSAI